jgi:hypothetical protein
MVVADALGTISLEKIGDKIQTFGNTTVIAGMIIELDEITNQLLIIKGNWPQSLRRRNGSCR